MGGGGDQGGRGGDDGERLTGEDMEELGVIITRKKLADEWLQRRLKSKAVHLPFEEAVKWVRAVGRWDTKQEWFEWLQMGEGSNAYIPSNPEDYYGARGEWKGWGYWLGRPEEEADSDAAEGADETGTDKKC